MSVGRWLRGGGWGVALCLGLAPAGAMGQGTGGSLEVTDQVYTGWKYFQVYCARCHGDNALGSMAAPDLTYSVSEEGGVTADSFAVVVRQGAVELDRRPRPADARLRGPAGPIAHRRALRLRPGPQRQLARARPTSPRAGRALTHGATMTSLERAAPPAVPVALAEALRERYVLEREIARGGMATVVLAREIGRDRPVAVKIMHPEVATMIGAERFRREIDLVRAMTHPGIVPLTDSGTAGGLFYYVMPFVDGETVYDRVRRQGRFPLADALRITHDVAAALGYAHDRGVLHRDVKPENILLTVGPTPGRVRALVADFGLARAIGLTNYQRLTETGIIVGTVFYMSPEQLREERNLDQRADVYSLGCILYEMLTGGPPYTGSSITDIVRRILKGSIPSAARANRDVPAAVDSAIARALAKAPSERFASMGEFSAALPQP